MSQTELTLEQIQTFESKYPKQLWNLFMIEMWERFCFYGMRGMLTVFMTKQLLLDDKAANLQYGAIQAFVYAFTFIGGLFADKILGLRKSLVWGAILMIIGGFTIAISPEKLFYLGICFSIVGTGFFKPNVSSMVGQLYKEGDSRRDAGFSLFYAGINLGAMLGGILMIWVGKEYSWSAAFALVGVVMILSLITLWLTKHNLGPIGLSPLAESPKRQPLEIGTYLGSIAVIPVIWLLVTNTTYTDLVMYLAAPLALLWIFHEISKIDDAATIKKLLAALVFIVFSVFFWAFFEQSGGSLSLFAESNLHSSLLGIEFGDKPIANAVNNSSNSVFVILFAAPVGLLWVWLASRKLEPNSVIKFGISFLLLGAGFYVMYSTIGFADKDGKTSLNVFTFAWLVLTFAELCLSPIGLSLMTKLSPQKMQGLMMGMWFLASAYGQYIAGILGAAMSVSAEEKDATNLDKLVSYTNGYYQLAVYALVLGVVLMLSPVVRRYMSEVMATEVGNPPASQRISERIAPMIDSLDGY
ncbi:MAG: peptide MFS transporter [Pirellulales bacterium]